MRLYVFCGDQLLAAKLRTANIDASAGAMEEIARIVGQVRKSWPGVRILLAEKSPSVLIDVERLGSVGIQKRPLGSVEHRFRSGIYKGRPSF